MVALPAIEKESHPVQEENSQVDIPRQSSELEMEEKINYVHKNHAKKS